MRKRFLAVLGALVMVACLLPTTAMAAEGDGLVSISDLVAHTDGTYDNQKDTEHYATNAAHLSYTYYDEEDGKTAVLTNSTKTRVPLVKTVTITGINFKELDDAQGKNGELNALSALIRNGRRIDSTEQFIDSVEVNFVNCTFNQTSIHLQVYKLFNVYAKKYTFKNCTFNQEDSGQYAITLNASQTGEYPISETETKEYNRPYSYEITNCIINSNGRGINITAGVNPQKIVEGMSSLPNVVIHSNTFNLPKSDSDNMAIQIAGNWDEADLTADSSPLITISDNEIDAYVAVRVHDSMGENTTDSAKYLAKFSNNLLLNNTQSVIAETGATDDQTTILQAIAEAFKASSEASFVTPPPYIPQVPSYLIQLPEVEGGTVTADRAAARQGTEVALTVTPDEGFALASLAVTDFFGNQVDISRNSDGTYSFVMPASQVTVSAAFAPAQLPFTDVTEANWYYDEVYYVWANGLMQGTSATTFGPGVDTTRAMVVTILWRLEGEPASGYDMDYSDVAGGAWYAGAVRWATEHGIVNGSEGQFYPGGIVTRKQLAAMLYRYAQYKGYDLTAGGDLSGFADAGAVSGWAETSLAWAVGQGLIQGSANQIDPTGSAIRAQLAAILMRFMENVAN